MPSNSDSSESSSTVELTNTERALELAPAIALVGKHRDILEELSDEDWSRLRYLDADYSDICCLSTAFLVEEDTSRGDMGRVKNYTTTDRAEYLLTAIPDGEGLTSDEVDGLLSAGEDVFKLPPAGDVWRARDLDDDIDIADRSLGVLHSSGLLTAKAQPIGHPTRWETTPALDSVKSLLAGLVNA